MIDPSQVQWDEPAIDPNKVKWDAPEPKEANLQDRAQSFASGVNEGVLTKLPGLPVDTVLNVWDLAKAATGYAGGKLGVSPENLPQLTNRSSIPGSSEWIANQVRKTGIGIDANSPDSMSRVLHSAGVAAGAFPVPGQLVKQAVSGAAAQATQELGAGPEWATLAGLAPFAGGARTSNKQQALLTPEQQAIRDRALELGYELTPGQISGKKWQQNLEAAMSQAPSTAGRMQEIAARNAQNTNRLVSLAQEASGGPLDQGSAGGMAMSGMNRGIERQADITGGGYRNLLRDVSVGLEPQRPFLESVRKGQQILPEDQRGGVAMSALDNLLGTPGYQSKSRSYSKPGLDPNTDDIIAAIRKSGGINPADEAVGSLAKANPFPSNPMLGPVWARPQYGTSTSNKTTGGHSLEGMAQRMYESGYINEPDPSLLMDKIADSAMGTATHYSVYKDNTPVDPLAQSINSLVAKLGEKNVPQSSPGFIRENPNIPGPNAQDLRSGYGAASNSAFEGGKIQQGEVYAKLKAAVDNAIETSLPAEKKGQFAALNAKYGFDMAIKAMSPKSQEAFLAQLYRGAPDQFYTFLGVADPASFSAASRGFISKLIESATNAESKNVSATALGKAIDSLNPGDTGRADVMKYFGGAGGKTLRDVGAIGRNVLPDQVANSGTAQRLWYQSLLRGGGMASGAGLGALLGGSPGAVLGSLLGDFVVPSAIQSAYLSPKMRGLLTKEGKAKPRLTPEQEAMLRYGGLLGYSSSLQH